MVLIVDDNQENIFSLKSLLALHNFEVDTASSGAEALRKVLKKTYSLIILDVQMPEMDGFEVAEAVSGYSKSKDIPIIFLSAVNTHKKFITKGYESGGIDYVTKPFDPDILLLKVKTFYRLSEQTQQLQEMEKNLRHEIELRKQAEAVLEKKVEERTAELKESNQRLGQSNRELQEFAFIASHDLQEPLRKIQTFSNLALEKHLEDRPKVQASLEKINSAAQRLRNLITDLLNYSRISTDQAFKPTNLNAIMDETLADLEVAISTICPDIQIGKFPEVEVIPSMMRQVFQNLLSNSLKFAREDVPCSIRIVAERVARKAFDSPVSPDGPFCRIMVRDNGIGFLQEYNQKIFEIFHQLNNREVYQGTGIGLAIVKKVIERHDGIITALGKENDGAMFIMVIPMAHQKSASPV